MTEFLLKSDVEEIVEHLGEVTHTLAGKSVLLTGGCGFLGRYFTHVFAHLNGKILKEPVQVIVLDNLITAGKAGAEIPDLPNFRFVQHDVILPFEYDGALDYVIHAAGIASPFYYRAYPLKTLEVAVTGTKNIAFTWSITVTKHDAMVLRIHPERSRRSAITVFLRCRRYGCCHD